MVKRYGASFILEPACEPVELPELPELPDTFFQEDAFMRGLGYRRTEMELDVDASKIRSSYTRDQPPLAWQEVFGAMDRLVDKSRAERWMLGPLLLPHWLPEPLRPVAELWAREHGWDGVVYDEPPSWLRDRPMKTNPEVWHG